MLALASAPEKLRNKQVVAFVDNIGSVIWWEKGWAKGCQLGNTVIRALYLLTKSLNCDLWVEHIHRCSCREARAADAILKSDFRVLRQEMREAERFPRRVPLTLVDWMKDPKPTRSLGESIFVEMAKSTVLLGHQCKQKSRWDI